MKMKIKEFLMKIKYMNYIIIYSLFMINKLIMLLLKRIFKNKCFKKNLIILTHTVNPQKQIFHYKHFKEILFKSLLDNSQ